MNVMLFELGLKKTLNLEEQKLLYLKYQNMFSLCIHYVLFIELFSLEKKDTCKVCFVLYGL